MTSIVLPHEVHGDGAHKVIAVHRRFADRSAYAAVPPDLDREAGDESLRASERARTGDGGRS